MGGRWFVDDVEWIVVDKKFGIQLGSNIFVLIFIIVKQVKT